jgi:hypothetical protein
MPPLLPNPTLSLTSGSSAFPNLSDQSDTYRIEESKIYDVGDDNDDDSKWDIDN